MAEARTPDVDRPAYPGIAEDVGEDPARFLSTDMQLAPIIRGMEELGRVNAWLQVARDLDVSRQRMRMLEDRQEYLIELERKQRG